MKKMIPVLIVTHIMCVLLGYWLGVNFAGQKDAPEVTIPTDSKTVETMETTIPTETIAQTVPTGEPTVTTEAPEETTTATEGTEAEEIPVYTPSVTTPPSTQPPATNPPATQPPSTGGNQNISGETPED